MAKVRNEAKLKKQILRQNPGLWITNPVKKQNLPNQVRLAVF
jgi:hypothetical protein